MKLFDELTDRELFLKKDQAEKRLVKFRFNLRDKLEIKSIIRLIKQIDREIKKRRQRYGNSSF